MSARWKACFSQARTAFQVFFLGAMAQFAVLPLHVQNVLRSNCAYVYEESYRMGASPARYLDVLELYSGVTRIASMASEACFQC